MKFVIGSELLKNCISKIRGGLGGATLASQSIKIMVNDSSVLFFTNNMKIGFICEIYNADIETPGEIVVDGNTLYRFVTAALSEEITMEHEEKFLIIKDGRRKVKLNSLEDEEFVMPKLAEEAVATIDMTSFKAMLKSAVPMAAKDNTIFEGVYIDNATVAASDRNKAVIIPFKSDFPEHIIITKEACKEIMNLSYDGDIILKSNNAFLTMGVGEAEYYITLTAHLIAGQYPDLNDFSKRIEQKYNLEVPLDDLLSEVNYMSLISDNEEQVIQMSINKDQRNIVFYADAFMGTDKSTTSMDIDVDKADIPENGFEFNFKASNMLSMLRSIKDFSEVSLFDTKNVKIHFSTSDKPIKLEIEGMYQFLSAIRSF